MWFAKRLARRIKEENMALIIQKTWKMHLAKMELHRRKEKENHRLKLFVITKLQAHFRRKRDTNIARQVKFVMCVIKIQSYLRAYQTKNIITTLKDTDHKIRLIQKWLKERYKYLKDTAIIIQKYYRTVLRIRRLKKEKQQRKFHNFIYRIFFIKKEKEAFNKLIFFSKAVKIQRNWRMIICKREYKHKLKTIAKYKTK